MQIRGLGGEIPPGEGNGRPLQYFAGKIPWMEDYLRPLRVNSQFIEPGMIQVIYDDYKIAPVSIKCSEPD